MRLVRHWHARAGVLMAIFFLSLAISGLALNHTDTLNLAKQHVSASWLMRWYGLKPSVPTRGYLFEDGYLAAAGGRWVMDGRVLADDNQAPVGAITWGDMRAVASGESLYMYLSEGQLVDKLTGSALPNWPIKQIGILDSGATPQLVLKTSQGSFVTNDGLTWKVLGINPSGASDLPGVPSQIDWSSEQTLPSSLSASLNEAFRPYLPLERIVLDIHSGRIFGRYGPILMDIAALGIIILSLSGVWIYLRTVRRKSRH